MTAKRIARLAAFCALAVTLAPKQGLASVFGFKAGMTKEQIVAILGGKAPTKVHDDAYTFSTAPSPHPEFESYICFISPEKGLLKVVALSKNIETNDFGEALKDKFEQIQAGVFKAYGQGKSYDYLKEGSIWNEPQDWMMGLLKDERTLETFWQLNPPQDHIAIIALKATALSREKGYVSLGYEFEGWEQYVDSKKEKQDNVY
jgi:hypothetical protein